MSGPGRARPAGEGRLPRHLGTEEQIAALESAHDFPGPFPVVVIARHESTFHDRLVRLLARMPSQGGGAVRAVPSREGRYVSYRLELRVETARAALDCRAMLAELEGVVLLF